MSYYIQTNCLPVICAGDVKPGNFCLKGSDLEVQRPGHALRAIDFGCSQMLGPEKPRLSRRSGTPAFMSPEIYAKDYSYKADMWSAGVMLYWWV